MVANIGSSRSLSGALDYNMRKVEKGEAEILATNKIFCPTDGTYSTAEIVGDFEDRGRRENDNLK